MFNNSIRTDASPKTYSESLFAFLDRSGRPEYEKVRVLISDWIAHVPPTERDDFVRRITSGQDVVFHSAFLELYVHELLTATGQSVTFHPELSGTKKRPDFRAVGSRAGKAIVECTVATEDSDKDRAAQARLNTLFDSINRVDCADVFLDLRVAGTPMTPVPGGRWRKKIQKWVDALDYDSLLAMGPVPIDANLPCLDLVHDGLKVSIKPIPKKSSARGKGQRSIGVSSGEGCIVTSHNEIRETVRDKAGRYGRMSCPYVVAVNCLGELADEEEIFAAMFGHSGLWKHSGNPAHTRVSAVLAIHHLQPSSVAVAPARLFQNPNAAVPYDGPLAALPRP